MSELRPDETEAEQADRNFLDLLQEVRVTQTGVQILFGFLLTLPLQSRFAELDDVEIGLFVACLVLSSAATVCLIAPVAYHRALFRRRMKHELVTVASRFAVAGLGLLGGAVVCGVALVVDLVLGSAWSALVGGVLLVAFVTFWLVLPLRLRRRQPHGDPRPSDPGLRPD